MKLILFTLVVTLQFCAPIFGLTLLGLGQSNLNGNEATPFFGNQTKVDKVSIWNKSTKRWERWDLSSDPVQFSSTSLAGGSPAQPDRNNLVFSAAARIAEFTGEDVRVIMSSEGRRALRYWGEKQPMWIDLENQLRESGAQSLDCVMFHQGEADYATPVESYTLALQELISRLRLLNGKPELPVVLGEIPAMERGSNPTTWRQNTSFKRTSNELRNVHYVSLSDLPLKSDNVHLTSGSLVRAGNRYAQAFLQEKSLVPPVKPTSTEREIPRELLPEHVSTRFIHDRESTVDCRIVVKRWEPFYWPLNGAVELGSIGEGEICLSFGGMAYGLLGEKKVHFLNLEKNEVARLERVRYYAFKLTTNSEKCAYSFDDEETLSVWLNPGGDGLLRKSNSVISLKNQVGSENLDFAGTRASYEGRPPLITFSERGELSVRGLKGLAESFSKDASVVLGGEQLKVSWSAGSQLGDIFVFRSKPSFPIEDYLRAKYQ